MLKLTSIRSVPGDLDRRWMSDDYFDLVVWYDPGGEIHGFQLCYDKRDRERALTWTRGDGYSHTCVDTGEGEPTANRTPVLRRERCFAVDLVKGEFAARGAALPVEIRNLVLARIEGYNAG